MLQLLQVALNTILVKHLLRHYAVDTLYILFLEKDRVFGSVLLDGDSDYDYDCCEMGE